MKIRQKKLDLPAFLPDATHATIKGVGSDDVLACNVDGLVVNTYHLMRDRKVETVQNVNGLSNFMSFGRPIITDSGGFQVMSLVRENPKNGKIKEDEIVFKLEGDGFLVNLTPENCIDTQIKLGSDIIMVLDDCTNPEEGLEEQEKSVERTLRWAKRCKDEFDKQTKTLKKDEKPLIFGIVQGGNSKELRKKCAEGLIEIGFDGFAYGGWPVDGSGRFLSEIVEYTAKLMPEDKIRYAMGVGKPEDIINCVKYGYNLFDCVLPTRDARHKRLYVFDEDIDEKDIFEESFYHFLHLGSGKHREDNSPISNVCDCVTCQNYSKAYLHHLFKIKDPLAIRLATIHNLRFYSMLMEKIRKTL